MNDKEFWESHPQILKVHERAKRSKVHPRVLLGHILTRVMASTPVELYMDYENWKGCPNFYALFLGPPAAGKGSVEAVSLDHFYITGCPRELPLGSYQGLLKYFAVDGADESMNPRPKNSHGYFSMSEAARLGNAEGLYYTLAGAWSGKMDGKTNATQEFSYNIPRNSFRLGVNLFAQPENAGCLLEQTNIGFTQRLLVVRFDGWKFDPEIARIDVDDLEVYTLPKGLTESFKMHPRAIAENEAEREQILEDPYSVLQTDAHRGYRRDKTAVALDLWMGNTEQTKLGLALADYLINESDAALEWGMSLAHNAAVTSKAIRNVTNNTAKVTESSVEMLVNRFISKNPTREFTWSQMQQKLSAKARPLAKPILEKMVEQGKLVTVDLPRGVQYVIVNK